MMLFLWAPSIALFSAGHSEFHPMYISCPYCVATPATNNDLQPSSGVTVQILSSSHLYPLLMEDLVWPGKPMFDRILRKFFLLVTLFWVWEADKVSPTSIVHCSNDRTHSVAGVWEQPPRGAPGYQVLSDILFRLDLIANCSHTVQYLDCSDLNWRCNHCHVFWHCMTLLVLMCR